MNSAPQIPAKLSRAPARKFHRPGRPRKCTDFSHFSMRLHLRGSMQPTPQVTPTTSEPASAPVRISITGKHTPSLDRVPYTCKCRVSILVSVDGIVLIIPCIANTEVFYRTVTLVQMPLVAARRSKRGTHGISTTFPVVGCSAAGSSWAYTRQQLMSGL